MYEFSGHSVMSWLLRTASFSNENKSSSQRADILAQLHQSHQGIETTQLLASEGVYWPNINKDIEHMTRTCTLCQDLANCNKKESLIPHDTPKAPWKKLGTDLFEVDGEHFVLIWLFLKISHSHTPTRYHK